MAKLNTVQCFTGYSLVKFSHCSLCVRLVFSSKDFNFFKAEVDVTLDFLRIPLGAEHTGSVQKDIS